MSAPTVFKIGHRTRTAEELEAVLRAAGIALVVDVRRFPGSRRHPQFARDALEQSLPRSGIGYEWWGEALGGRRSVPKDAPTRHPAWRNSSFRAYADHMDSNDFQHALESVEAAAAERRLAIMCAERLWWKCHRRLISDAVALRGRRVIHLVDVGVARSHVLHDNVRLDERGRVTYDVGITPELDIG